MLFQTSEVFVYVKFVKIWKLCSNKYRSSILKENKEFKAKFTILFTQKIYTELFQGCNGYICLYYLLFYSDLLSVHILRWSFIRVHRAFKLNYSSLILQQHLTSIKFKDKTRLRRLFQSPHFDDLFKIRRSDMIKGIEQLGEL